LGITIVVFFIMIALYIYVFHPSNKEKLEAHRHIPLDDDDFTLYERERENRK
jgi:cytochrome c oxidase cbb3-type subunit 4